MLLIALSVGITEVASGGPGEALPLLATSPPKGFALRNPMHPGRFATGEGK